MSGKITKECGFSVVDGGRKKVDVVVGMSPMPGELTGLGRQITRSRSQMAWVVAQRRRGCWVDRSR